MSNTVALYFFQLTSSGGAERMLCTLANALTERGYDVHVISLDDHNATSFYPLDEKISWHRIGFDTGAVGKLKRVVSLVRLIKTHKIDTLIGFVMSGDKTIYAACKLTHTKIIAAERNAPKMYWIRYNALTRRVSFLLLRLTNSIAVQAKSFIEFYPRSLQSKIHTIPNPVLIPNVTANPANPGPNGRFSLIAVGRLDPVQKGFSCLVEAFSKIADQNPLWDLHIYGDGPEKDTLSELISNLKLKGRVTLHPATPDIQAIYPQSQLFVIPSLWEGFPNALAEAMSFGLPVIGFKEAQGVADLMSTHSGWLANGAADHESLAECLHQAMNNPEEREKRGSQARVEMINYDPEKQFDKWVALIVNNTLTTAGIS